MAGSVHDGHRERLRRRVLNESMDYFEPHEVLELLLYYVVRQGDTNALAHRLINKFGSFAKVLDANRSKMEEVDGVGESISFFLSVIPQICRRYMLSRSKDRLSGAVMSSDHAHEILAPYFIGRKVEMLYLLCLNGLGEPIDCVYISEGSANATSINIRKIVEVIIETNATAVILCHNHPDGIARPSHQDVVLTKNLSAVLEAMNVVLLDHLIIVDGDFISFRDSDEKEDSDGEEGEDMEEIEDDSLED